MNMIIQETVEYRRTELINKLIGLGVFKIEEKRLFESSLTELESEYNKLESDMHPHSELGSIRFTKKKAKSNKKREFIPHFLFN